jgi:microcystin-dependent protein
MEDAFIGTIMAVAYDYAPYGWLPCNGQLLAVQQYQALYALLGNTYGGVANQTFALPDLRGYAVIGAGGSVTPGRTMPPVNLATSVGANSLDLASNGAATLTIGSANLPQVAIGGALDTTKLNTTSVLSATTSGPGATAPAAGASLSASGTGVGAAAIYYVNPTPSTPVPLVALNSDSVQSSVDGAATFTTAPLGSGTPLSNLPVAATAQVPTMQPSLGMTYIICWMGDFPVRP